MKVKPGWEGVVVAIGIFAVAMALVGTLKLLVG
jgi:hypothetical protein